MKTLKLIIFSIIIFLNFSCNQKPKGLTPIDKFQKKLAIKPDTLFLNKYPIRELPYVDSSNFHNFHFGDSLTENQIQILGLNEIVPDYKINIWINYKLNISTKFNSIVASYQPNENELYTILINYNNSNEIIDFDTIAYDEIAENCIKIQSIIANNKIELKNINYCSEESENPEIQTKLLMIHEDGEINAMK